MPDKRIVHVGDVEIQTRYCMHASLSRWMGHEGLVHLLSDNPRGIIEGLREGKNLFALIPDFPKEKLLEPKYEDGVSPDFYNIALLRFHAVDNTKIEGQDFFGIERTEGPYFFTAYSRQMLKIPENAEVFTLNPMQVVSEEIMRLREAIKRR
jgi:hypothetical protein